MQLSVVFPSDFFNPKKPDAIFAEQYRLFSDYGFTVATLSLDKEATRVFPNLPQNTNVLYRGWMLTSEEYQKYVQCIHNAGCQPFTTHQEYLLCHHIPNWYPYISSLTPETYCFEQLGQLESELYKLGWKEFFVKDYVKSLKTASGSRIDSPAKINGVLSEMEKYKGMIEGGICARCIEAFDEGSEQRYFVLNGVPYSASGQDAPEIVKTCAARIPSKFFSVDTIKRADGILRVVELGDGQVSDLVGWSEDRFVQLWTV